MTTASHFQPNGYHTVTPFVIVKGAAGFIDYMTRAFDAVELGRMGEDGAIGHAEVRIGDAVVMLFDARPDWPWTPAFLRIYVADCDEAWQRAIDEGGASVTEPGTMPWGDRVARVRDPFGNLWWIQTRLEDLTEAEQAARWQMPEYLAAVQAAQDSEFFPTAEAERPRARVIREPEDSPGWYVPLNRASKTLIDERSVTIDWCHTSTC